VVFQGVKSFLTFGFRIEIFVALLQCALKSLFWEYWI